jgi:ABC-type transporter Mla maintaining outer membrane lipid asymmetry ATPase subunit MlaF
LTSEYARIGERGKIEFKDEGQQLCLTNTSILMLRHGREIFSGTSKELIDSDDPYIQEFIRGTELVPERVDTSQEQTQEENPSEST